MGVTTRSQLKEDRLHGNSMFPAAIYELYTPPGEQIYELHWHDEAELGIVLEGSALIQIGEEELIVGAGEAFFIDGGDIHAALQALGEEPCVMNAFVFDPAWLSSGSFDSVEQRYIVPFREKKRTFPRLIKQDTEWSIRLLNDLNTIHRVIGQAGEGYEIKVKSLLYGMLAEVVAAGVDCDRSEASSAYTGRIERLKTVITYMQSNYHRTLRIHELALLIPMSEGQFSRFFKAMTQSTPIEYLNAYRIKKAATLLVSSDRKISDIAMDTGFDNVSYFIRVFKRLMKCTPSEFRDTDMRHKRTD